MRSIDLFDEERQMVETVLAILETLAVRLNTGEPLPNAILGDVVDFLRVFEDAAYDASEISEGQPCLSRCVAQHETARVLLRQMQGALESLERGEAGAVGAFVRSAREYIRAYRDHMRVDDSYFPMPTAEAQAPAESALSDLEKAPQHLAVLRRFNRLVERYRDVAGGALTEFRHPTASLANSPIDSAVRSHVPRSLRQSVVSPRG